MASPWRRKEKRAAHARRLLLSVGRCCINPSEPTLGPGSPERQPRVTRGRSTSSSWPTTAQTAVDAIGRLFPGAERQRCIRMAVSRGRSAGNRLQASKLASLTVASGAALARRPLPARENRISSAPTSPPPF